MNSSSKKKNKLFLRRKLHRQKYESIYSFYLNRLLRPFQQFPIPIRDRPNGCKEMVPKGEQHWK